MAAILALASAHAGATSGRDTLIVGGAAWASASSNKSLRPLLSYSNEWGRYTQYDRGEIAMGASVKYAHKFKNQSLRFTTGLTAQLSSDSERTMLHELYADFDLWMFGVKMGMENYTPIESNTGVSVGSYLMSNNARTVPRVWVGILDYWSLPLDKLPWAPMKKMGDLLQIRGGMSFGLLDDEGRGDAVDGALLHEKFAYARIGQFAVKPYAGLYHSVVMGGTLPNGVEIPTDFWNSFFGRNGDMEVFGTRFLGETTNAAGAHQGMWDFGLDISWGGVGGKLYYQRPFSDGKTLNPAKGGIKDFSCGILMSFSTTRFVKEAALEYTTTKWQGGEGFPDPYIPTQSGQMMYIYPGHFNTVSIPHFRETVLLPEDVAEWEAKNGKITEWNGMNRFLMDTYNHGEEFGGRILYLYNWAVPQGWTRGGLSMGSPLFHSRKTVRQYAPAGSMDFSQAFPNVRVRAVNIGLRGDIAPGRVDYALRVTLSRNYGNYREKYTGNDPSSSWVLKENFFNATATTEIYTKLDLNFKLRGGFGLQSQLAYDFGELYHSFSARLGIRYKFEM